MVRIIVVGLLIAAALGVAKQQDLFRKAGVVGSCQIGRAPIGDDSSWYACREGVLTGYPSLRRDNCTSESRTASYQYWRCPTPLAHVPGY